MDNDLAIFKACADATRLRILFLLAVRDLCVCELVEVLKMPQGKVSRHLAVLKNADLVRDRREGTWIYYSLAQVDGLLQKKLHAYLLGTELTEAKADRSHLEELTRTGQICGSHEAVAACC